MESDLDLGLDLNLGFDALNCDSEACNKAASEVCDAGARYVANVYEGNNHIVDDELNGYINQIRKRAGINGFVYVVIDACHAGGSSRGDEYDEDEELFTRGTCVGFSEANKRYAPRIDKRPVIRVPQKEGVAGTCYMWLYNALNVAVPIVLLALSTVALIGDSYNPFIYYRF